MLAVLISTLLGLQFVTYTDQIISIDFNFGSGSGSGFESGFDPGYRIIRGGCPDKYKPGDVIYLQGCQKIECHATFTTTRSCRTSHIDYDRESCYVRYNLTLKYPACCKPILVCTGDKGFNKTKLAENKGGSTLFRHRK